MTLLINLFHFFVDLDYQLVITEVYYGMKDLKGMVAVCVFSRASGRSAKRLILYYRNGSMLEWFSNDCSETSIKVFTPTIDNWSKSKQGESDESFGIPTNFVFLAKSAGNIARTRCDWSSFC